MSDGAWFSLPTGRKLERPDYDPNYVGTLGVLRRADEPRLRLARRHMRELDARHVQGDGRYLLDTTTGETLEVVTSFVDLADPKSTGATAFVVRDGWLVPLRPVGWKHEADESKYVGEFGGRRATPSDPLPGGPGVY